MIDRSSKHVGGLGLHALEPLDREAQYPTSRPRSTATCEQDPDNNAAYAASTLRPTPSEPPATVYHPSRLHSVADRRKDQPLVEGHNSPTLSWNSRELSDLDSDSDDDKEFIPPPRYLGLNNYGRGSLLPGSWTVYQTTRDEDDEDGSTTYSEDSPDPTVGANASATFDGRRHDTGEPEARGDDELHTATCANTERHLSEADSGVYPFDQSPRNRLKKYTNELIRGQCRAASEDPHKSTEDQQELNDESSDHDIPESQSVDAPPAPAHPTVLVCHPSAWLQRDIEEKKILASLPRIRYPDPQGVRCSLSAATLGAHNIPGHYTSSCSKTPNPGLQRVEAHLDEAAIPSRSMTEEKLKVTPARSAHTSMKTGGGSGVKVERAVERAAGASTALASKASRKQPERRGKNGRTSVKRRCDESGGAQAKRRRVQ